VNLLRRPTRAALWLLVPIGFFVWAVASLWPHTIDDTYIYVLYAKNQVEGNGLVFNLGQRVDAMSNYLWVLVMALGGHLGAPILGWAKAVSAVLSTAQLVLAWWLTRLAIDATLGEPVAPAAPKPKKKGKKKTKGDAPEPPPPAPDAAWFWRDALACLTPAMMVLQPGTAYYSANGLGTPLFTLLTLLGVALHLHDLVRSGRPDRPWCYAPLAIASLTRPEAPLFLVAVAAHRGWLLLGPAKGGSWPEAGAETASRPLRTELVALGLAVALPVAGHLGRYVYYGDFLNTFYCKPSTFFQNPTAAVGYVHDFAATHGVLLGGALLVGWAAALWKAPRWRVAGLLLMMAGAHFVFILYSGGDWMAQYRFFQPVLALMYGAAVVGLARLERHRAAAWIVAGLCLLGTGNVRQFIEDLDSNTVYDHAHRSQVNVEVAHWMAENLRPGAGLITDEIGAIGLYSGLVIHDQWGIVDRELAHMFHDTGFNPYNTAPDDPLRTKSLTAIADILVAREPEYVLLDSVEANPAPGQFDERKLNPYTMRELYRRIRYEYRYVRSFPVMEASDIEFRAKTFLLFERKDLAGR